MGYFIKVNLIVVIKTKMEKRDNFVHPFHSSLLHSMNRPMMARHREREKMSFQCMHISQRRETEKSERTREKKQPSAWL